MTNFADDLNKFTLKVHAQTRGVFMRTVQLVQGSVVHGSPVTGAPGQPVKTGYLKNSWQPIRESATSYLIATNVVYAPEIEAGMRLARTGQVTGNTTQRLTLRSPTGGFHSVALTIAGFQRLVAQAIEESGEGRAP